MIDRHKYIEWLINNPKHWSEATIHKYESATRIISAQMHEKGTIVKGLYDMTKTELDAAILFIFNDEDFKKKDSVGNKMYSNGLKQYRSFVASTIEEMSNDDYATLLENRVLKDEEISVTERNAIVSARVGQGKFRSQLIDKYGKCVVTGVDNKKLLIASHIKPWSQCDNADRISVDNGLLLTPTYDKLFDYGLITFSESGKLLVSSFVGKENEKRLKIPTNEIFDIGNTKQLLANMQYHNDVLFVR